MATDIKNSTPPAQGQKTDKSENQAPVLLVKDVGPVLHVTLNRPQSRNPLSKEIIDCLNHTFLEHASNTDLKVAIITGAGNKAFAAGGDVKELMSVRTADQTSEMSNTTRAVFQTIRDFPVPVIAALNGDALGGGAEFAIACDIRIAAPHCRIGFIQGRLNISTAWGGAHDLIQLIGPSRALELMSRGEIVDMKKALRYGLINEVIPEGEELTDAVTRYIAPILEMSPHVVRSFKSLTREAKNTGREKLDQLETKLLTDNWIHDDHWSAVSKLFSKKR